MARPIIIPDVTSGLFSRAGEILDLLDLARSSQDEGGWTVMWKQVAGSASAYLVPRDCFLVQVTTSAASSVMISTDQTTSAPSVAGDRKSILAYCQGSAAPWSGKVRLMAGDTIYLSNGSAVASLSFAY